MANSISTVYAPNSVPKPSAPKVALPFQKHKYKPLLRNYQNRTTDSKTLPIILGYCNSTNRLSMMHSRGWAVPEVDGRRFMRTKVGTKPILLGYCQRLGWDMGMENDEAQK